MHPNDEPVGYEECDMTDADDPILDSIWDRIGEAEKAKLDPKSEWVAKQIAEAIPSEDPEYWGAEMKRIFGPAHHTLTLISPVERTNFLASLIRRGRCYR